MLVIVILVILYAYYLNKKYNQITNSIYRNFFKSGRKKFQYIIKEENEVELNYKNWVDEIRKLLSFNKKKKWRGMNLKFRLRKLLSEVAEKRRFPFKYIGVNQYRHKEIYRKTAVHENPQEVIIKERNAKTELQERTFKCYGWRQFKIYLTSATWWIRNHTPINYPGLTKKPYRDNPNRLDKKYNKYVRKFNKTFRKDFWVERKPKEKFNPVFTVRGRDYVEEFLRGDKNAKRMESEMRKAKMEIFKQASFYHSVAPGVDWKRWSLKKIREAELAYIENEKKKSTTTSGKSSPNNSQTKWER